MDCVDIPFDSVWCPVCSREIVPKRIHLPAPAPAQSKNAQQQDAHPRLTRGKTGAIRPRAAGLVHGTGRVKPNSTIKRSPTKDASAEQDSTTAADPAPSRPAAPTRQRTVIDPSPAPLYCSDECRLHDLQATHSALDINYNPERCASPQRLSLPQPAFSVAQSTNEDSDSSSGSSLESRSSIASPSTTTTSVHATPFKGDVHEQLYQRLAAIYNFAPLPPPLPFTPKATKPAPPAPAPRFEGGVMMAARRIQAALCPEKPKRSSWGLPVQSDPEEDNKPIPGWTDGSQAWRACVYNFAPPRDFTRVDVDEAAERAYGSHVASPHRSRGVHSTLGENKPATEAVPNRSSSTASLPARVMDPSTEKIYKQYSASFTRRSESRTSFHSQSRGLSTSPTGSTRSALAREFSLVPPGAEGRLLLPNVKMRRTNSSMSSMDGASGYSWSSASATLSTAGSVAGRVRNPLSRQNIDVSVDSVETQSEDGELEVAPASVSSVPAPTHRMPPNTRSWSYDSEAFTYEIMPPKPKYVKQMVNGIEQDVELYEPIKRLFLFSGARN